MNETLKRWMNQAQEKGALFILDVCDTFSREDYPVYVMPEDDLEVVKKRYDGPNMQRVNGVISVLPKAPKVEDPERENPLAALSWSLAGLKAGFDYRPKTIWLPAKRFDALLASGGGKGIEMSWNDSKSWLHLRYDEEVPGLLVKRISEVRA